MTRRVDDVIPEAALPWAAFFVASRRLKGGPWKSLIPNEFSRRAPTRLARAELQWGLIFKG